jgi:hypothetical protein
MLKLNHLAESQRLFTYKVAHDGGSAPNPFHGLCTLAICKPAIRRVAKPGDLVVGLDCGSESSRIVYCMVVEGSLAWSAYIEACHGRHAVPASSATADSWTKKIPSGPEDPGDCIWTDHAQYADALDSWSHHGGHEDFARDVVDGQKVLFGTTFWYFGKGDQHQLRLADDLSATIPGRGHRSNANREFREPFVDFFNVELVAQGISSPGRWGTPALEPAKAAAETRSRCRAAEREFDQHGEEL